VLAARDLDQAVEELRAALPLGEPYSDPGVGLFGLRNAVMALGDTFVEVVSPTQPDTAAGRFLERRGDGAYMAMFQIDDLAGARERAKELGIREVWSIELPDIAACHLHPADIGAAIVSLDRPDPPESWRWAGPWEPHGDAKTTGLTLRASDPQTMAHRWRTVLGHMELDDGRLEVQQGDEDGIAAFHVSGLATPQLEVAGATFLSA
jgi:Glyoxalase-like domain